VSALRVQRSGNSVRFAVHVQPRAARTEIVGLHGDALKIRVTSPPVEGAANEAIVEVVAAALGISRREVRIVAGATSRQKTVEVDGTNEDAIIRLASRR
jgi:hypothetical protein